jgi:hypothetical protein
VDHPVLAPRGEEDVAPRGPCAVQDDHDLVVPPFLQVIGTAVPEAHVTAAILSFRDVTGERGVLERMVLGVDGQVV